MPAGRPPKVTPEIEKKIGECFLFGFTDEETATMTGVSSKTIQRARAGQFCPSIKKAELERRAVYIQRISEGKRRDWQRWAWFLERRYPEIFCRPELRPEFNLTVNNQTTNQVLVIQAEVAGKISERVKAAESEIDKLLKAKRNGHQTNGNTQTIENT